MIGTLQIIGGGILAIGSLASLAVPMPDAVAAATLLGGVAGCFVSAWGVGARERAFEAEKKAQVNL